MAEFVEVMNQRKRICESMDKLCKNCPLSIRNNGGVFACETFLLKRYEQAEKIIMDWAKEHPIVTNKDKFREVFGFKPSDYINCPMKNGYECLQHRVCEDCKYENFWNQEYKEPNGEPE